jgi:hypothetical protein
MIVAPRVALPMRAGPSAPHATQLSAVAEAVAGRPGGESVQATSRAGAWKPELQRPVTIVCVAFVPVTVAPPFAKRVRKSRVRWS